MIRDGTVKAVKSRRLSFYVLQPVMKRQIAEYNTFSSAASV
jgi:hypothetical protein